MSLGGIYSDQKCNLCGASLIDIDGLYLACRNHGGQRPTKFKVKIYGTTYRRNSYADARELLGALRAQGPLNSGSKSRNLGGLLDEFISTKEDMARLGRIKPRSVKIYYQRLMRIVGFIGPEVKLLDLGYRDMERFLLKSSYSPKSKHDTMNIFKEMMGWSHKCGYITELPVFPDWKFDPREDMNRTEGITKNDQRTVLSEIKKNESPRAYLACKWLCTYINVRPGELVGILEGDINRTEGTIVIRNHKTSSRHPKVVKLIQEDATIVAGLPRAIPGLRFFRHKDGSNFGSSLLSRIWKRNSKAAGVKGVTLYGGTRHTSAIALYRDAGLSPEEIKRAGGWRSMASYDRYFGLDIDDIAVVHQAASPGV